MLLRYSTALLTTTFLAAGLGVALAQAPVKPATPTAAAPTTTTPALVVEPRDVVAAIYKSAVATVRKKGESPIEDPAIRAKYFSKSFDVALTAAETRAAHDGKPPFDFDPISAAQDAELQKVTIKTGVLEPGKASVSASFLNHGQSTVVSYDFVKEDGAWKVDDIKGTTEKEAWSVRKILRNPAREPKALPGMKDASKAPDADVKVTPPKRPDEKALQTH